MLALTERIYQQLIREEKEVNKLLEKLGIDEKVYYRRNKSTIESMVKETKKEIRITKNTGFDFDNFPAEEQDNFLLRLITIKYISDKKFMDTYHHYVKIKKNAKRDNFNDDTNKNKKNINMQFYRKLLKINPNNNFSKFKSIFLTELSKDTIELLTKIKNIADKEYRSKTIAIIKTKSVYDIEEMILNIIYDYHKFMTEQNKKINHMYIHVGLLVYTDFFFNTLLTQFYHAFMLEVTPSQRKKITGYIKKIIYDVKIKNDESTIRGNIYSEYYYHLEILEKRNEYLTYNSIVDELNKQEIFEPSGVFLDYPEYWSQLDDSEKEKILLEDKIIDDDETYQNRLDRTERLIKYYSDEQDYLSDNVLASNKTVVFCAVFKMIFNSKIKYNGRTGKQIADELFRTIEANETYTNYEGKMFLNELILLGIMREEHMLEEYKALSNFKTTINKKIIELLVSNPRSKFENIISEVYIGVFEKLFSLLKLNRSRRLLIESLGGLSSIQNYCNPDNFIDK